MALIDLELDVPARVLPTDVSEYLLEANDRIRQFQHHNVIPGFVQSDFTRVYETLAVVVETHLAPGPTFCEWGSGFGVAAGLACLLGFHAHGIEIEPELIDHARALAEDFDLHVEFAHGTFVPPGREELTDDVDEFAWLVPGGADGHEELDLDPDDVDVVFAYPWPGEEAAVEQLFDACAAHGAVLVTYHGIEDVRVRRKVRD